jgi:hypothetical protein
MARQARKNRDKSLPLPSHNSLLVMNGLTTTNSPLLFFYY